MYGRETKRLTFIIKRDGIDKAVEFARRGIKIYRKAVLINRGSAYRRSMIENYIIYKKFIKNNTLSG